MGIDRKTGYYSLRAIMGLNCKYMIVLSDRGRGKSYGTKIFLINQEGTFMCLYRTTPDMNAAMQDWIDPLVAEGFPFTAFEWDGNDKDGYTLLYNGAPKGYFRTITQVNHIKQEVFPDDLNWVWLDEFIPLVYKKLPGVVSEGDAIRTIVKTIEHDTVHTREEKGLKPVRVLLYANPFTWNNPILSYFHIDPSKGFGVHKAGPGVAYEILEPYDEDKKDKKMTVDEFLGDEVNRNQGWMSQDAYVEEIPKGSVPFMSVRLNNLYFTFYKDQQRRVYLEERRAHTDIQKISVFTKKPILERYGTMEGLQEDEVCIDGTKWKQTWQGKAYAGVLYYKDINCKFDFLNALNELR